MSDLVCKLLVSLQISESFYDEVERAMRYTHSNLNVRSFIGHRRPHKITVETYVNSLDSVLTRDETSQSDQLNVFSGDPFFETYMGVLHLYKERRSDSVTLCLLGIPKFVTCRRLIQFVAPFHANIARIRVMREDDRNQFMALFTFRDNWCAVEFLRIFNGVLYDKLESNASCRVVWATGIEWTYYSTPPYGYTELPNCVTCLERMDQSISGLLAVLYEDNLYGNWDNSRCVACRSLQRLDMCKCEYCGQRNPEDLWICLICGYLGCSRYYRGHALTHSRESSHFYALQLGTHSVWDYKGDNFVHSIQSRIVSNEGMPVKLANAQEEVDFVHLEYTRVLTEQLEEQRVYFERKLAHVNKQAASEEEKLNEQLNALVQDNKTMKSKLGDLQKETVAEGKKINHHNARLQKMVTKLNNEKQLTQNLKTKQEKWESQFMEVEDKLFKSRKNKKMDVMRMQFYLRNIQHYMKDGSDSEDHNPDGKTT